MENFTYEKIEKVINFCVKRVCKQISLQKEDKEDIINNLWVHALQIKKEFDTSTNVEHCTAYLAKSIVRELAKEIDRVLLESVDRREVHLTVKHSVEEFAKGWSVTPEEIKDDLKRGLLNYEDLMEEIITNICTELSPLSSDTESNLIFKIDSNKFYKSLSPKEQEVLKNLYLGLTREEMAERFGKKTAQDFDYTVRSIKRKYLRFFREKNIFKT